MRQPTAPLRAPVLQELRYRKLPKAALLQTEHWQAIHYNIYHLYNYCIYSKDDN